jgi:hypothetical protein
MHMHVLEVVRKAKRSDVTERETTFHLNLNYIRECHEMKQFRVLQAFNLPCVTYNQDNAIFKYYKCISEPFLNLV